MRRAGKRPLCSISGARRGRPFRKTCGRAGMVACALKNPLPTAGITFAKIFLMRLFFEKKNNLLSREANIETREDEG